ncbi:hypothetical protein TNCV_382171 [Trichonephila clavipes]|nr:hypothetical protein TNCV_382171 [Trichonephila clavipes]
MSPFISIPRSRAIPNDTISIPRSRAIPNDTLPYGTLNQVMIEIKFKCVLHLCSLLCRHFTLSDGNSIEIAWIRSLCQCRISTDQGWTNKIGFPILTRCSTRLRGHFPSFKMKYNTTMARGFGINQELSQGVGGVFATVATHSGQKNRD